MVGVAQHFLPEPPPGGQERVIGHEELIVVVVGGEAGVLEMAGQFALIGVQALRDGGLVLRLLAEDRLADDTLDIGIRKLHAHSKAGLKPLQAGRSIQRGLAGADKKKALVQLRAAMLRNFLQIHRALDFLADELLNFVHDEQRAGKLAFLTEDLLEKVERLTHGGRGDIGKAGTYRLLDVGHRSVFRVGMTGVPRQGVPNNSDSATSSSKSQLFFFRAFATGASRPEERSQSMNFAWARSSGRPADRRTSCTKASRTLSMEPAPRVPAAARKPPKGLAAISQFLQQVGNFRRQFHERAGGRTVDKAVILPEITQHFDEMGLAAAEEAADPDSLLLLPPKAFEVGLENPLQSAGVFAIADKGLQLEAERLDLALVMANFGDLRDAVIKQLNGCGVAEVEFAVSHGLMKLSVEVMGTAM